MEEVNYCYLCKKKIGNEMQVKQTIEQKIRHYHHLCWLFKDYDQEIIDLALEGE